MIDGGTPMAVESTAISLSNLYFLKNFYSNNRSLATSSNRKTYSNSELSYEDSLALGRAVKKLKSFSYSSSENSDTINGAIKAFVETYNNTLTSASGSSNSDASRQAKLFKKYTDDNADALKKIGITVKSDGSLSCSKNLLKKADIEDLKSAFGKDNKYLQNLSRTAKRLNSESYDYLYRQMTGTGGNINLSL